MDYSYNYLKLAQVAAAVEFALALRRRCRPVVVAGKIFFTSAAKENISITKTIIKVLAMEILFFSFCFFTYFFFFINKHVRLNRTRCSDKLTPSFYILPIPMEISKH